jgi:hypothetical protein
MNVHFSQAKKTSSPKLRDPITQGFPVVDPIFALIERHRQFIKDTDARIEISDEESDRAGDEAAEMVAEMVKRIPATMEGAFALLRYSIECHTYQEEGFPEAGAAAGRPGDAWGEELRQILDHLCGWSVTRASRARRERRMSQRDATTAVTAPV